MSDKPKLEGKLGEFFARINMSELPAMSEHVRELISLTHSSKSGSYDLSKVILKDYSLTNKVLQVVNSAFFSLGTPVSSISRAVTILGFDNVRELATAIALFEDLLKAGVEKESISMLLTKSFLGAMQARELVANKGLNAIPEEAFICSLLRNLGKIIVCIYAPDMYREIQSRIDAGEDEQRAGKAVLGDFTLHELGVEVAKFWNLSERIIGSMDPDPPPPQSGQDAEGYLKNVAKFSNTLIEHVIGGRDIGPLLEKFGKIVEMNRDEALESVARSVEASEDLSESVRYGLHKLKMRNRLKAAVKGETIPVEEKKTILQEREEGTASVPEHEVLGELPISRDKSVNDFIQDITQTLMGPFDLNDFYVNLLEALYQGIGFDRVMIAILDPRPGQNAILGRFGLGDVTREAVSGFRHGLADTNYAIPIALKTGKDLAISPDKLRAFPDELHDFLRNRTVYIFPILIDRKPIGIIMLDRKQGRPMLDQGQVKTVRLFRDFAVMAIRKISKRR